MLIILATPGPPEDIKVEHISSTTAVLSWKSGIDNNSPVQIYSIQTKTPFSVGWQVVSTGEQFESFFLYNINLHIPLMISKIHCH